MATKKSTSPKPNLQQLKVELSLAKAMSENSPINIMMADDAA